MKIFRAKPRAHRAPWDWRTDLAAALLGALLFALFWGCGGCVAKGRYTVIPADEELVPVVSREAGAWFAPAQPGEDCSGWYVPNAAMLRIRRKLNGGNP